MKKLSDKNMQTARITLIALTIVLAAATFVKADDYAYEGGALWLQHIGTLALLLPLLADLKLRKFSLPACICLFIFICLHILGARYLYTNVPYRDWVETLFGWKIPVSNEHDNKYDRLVHFAFGLLLLPLFLNIAKRWLKIRSYAVALLFAWLAIQSCSMLYEIFEWLLSEAMGAEYAEGYNGQQGDKWDAQKDMFLALIGSTISAAVVILHRRFVGRRAPENS